MMSVWNILRNEHLWDIAREAVWRARKGWRSKRTSSLCEKFQGTFRQLNYFLPLRGFLSPSIHKELIKVADKISAGYFPLFGFGDYFLGEPPLWNVDFVSGRDWSNVASEELPVVRYDGSDVKVPWEVSRLQFLPVLAKAFRVTLESKYRHAALRLLQAWIHANPVGQGVNWTIAMEPSLRAISICLTLDLLHPFSESETDWRDEVLQSLWEHLQFIESHDEFSYFVTSNHYLSNIVGRFLVACHLEWPGATHQRDILWQKIEQEIRKQVYSDGGDYEASNGYHILVTQLFTVALRVAELSDITPSAGFTRLVERMYVFIQAVSDSEGCLPQVGDCDDGRVEWTEDDFKRFSGISVENDSLDSRDLIGLGCALARKVSPFFSSTASWYGLQQKVNSDKPIPRLSTFSESGIYKGKSDSAEFWFLALPNGIWGKGSHTHNDKLSVLLSLAGTHLLVDSGTFVYTRDVKRRNQFRSTRAHSTLMVDGLEQNDIVPQSNFLFRLTDHAQVRSTVENEDHEKIIVAGTHEGFSRVGVKHFRRCVFEQKSLEISDQLGGSEKHSVELSFIIAPGWKCVITEGAVVAVRGESQAIIKTTAPCPLTLQIHPWEISRAYGSLLAATRVAILAETMFPVQISTVISWE